MNILSRTFILFFCLINIFTSQAFSKPLISAEKNDLVFQIDHEGLILNGATVAAANIEQIEKGSNRCSILIKLNFYADQQLEIITEKNIGKTAVISFNGKIISSSTIQSKLSWQLLVNGLTKEEAEQFINHLTPSDTSEKLSQI